MRKSSCIHPSPGNFPRIFTVPQKDLLVILMGRILCQSAQNTVVTTVQIFTLPVLLFCYKPLYMQYNHD